MDWMGHPEADKVLSELFKEDPSRSDDDLAVLMRKKYPGEYISAQSISHRRRFLGLKRPRSGRGIRSPKHLSLIESMVLGWLTREEMSIGEISRRLDRSKETVIRVLDSLKSKGYDVELDDTSHQAVLHRSRSLKFKPLEIKDFYRRYVKIGIISDTHLCSKWQQLSLLHKAFDCLLYTSPSPRDS